MGTYRLVIGREILPTRSSMLYGMLRYKAWIRSLGAALFFVPKALLG